VLQGIDMGDTGFVALAEHVKSKLWSGDKKLIRGLELKNWKRGITTDDLYLCNFSIK